MKLQLKKKKLTAITSLLVVAVFSCTNNFEEVTNFKENDPFQSSVNTIITYSLKAKVKSQIKADTINQYPQDSANNRVEFPAGFEASFFDSLNQIESQITAKFGLWLKSQNLMIASENVKAYTKEGDTLYTEKLFWQQDSAIIYTNEAVKIVKPNMIIFGKGLEADQEFKKYRIQEITGTVAIEE